METNETADKGYGSLCISAVHVSLLNMHLKPMCARGLRLRKGRKEGGGVRSGMEWNSVENDTAVLRARMIGWF